MARFRSVIFLLLTVAVCATQSGCVAIYWKRPIDVLVLDAETCEPIEGASVDVFYMPRGIDFTWGLAINKPDGARVLTDSQGRATIPVANFAYICWNAEAPGYRKNGGGSVGSCRVPENLHPPLEKVRGHSAEIRLYREPPPRLTIVVPDGYRGLLLVEMRPTKQPRLVESSPGPRDFVVHTNARGYVCIDETPLLEGCAEICNPLHVRQACGDVVPDYSDPNFGPEDITLHSVDSITVDGHKKHLYVIGTQADVDKLHPVVNTCIDGNPRHTTSNHEGIDGLFTTASTGES